MKYIIYVTYYILEAHATRQKIFVIYIQYLIYIYIYIYLRNNIVWLFDLFGLVWFYNSVFFSCIISRSEPIKYCA